MNFKITFLPESKDDAKEIRKYLEQFYKGTAKKFFTLLKKHINSLKSNPYINQQYPERPSFRRLVVGDYLVFYKVVEEKKLVEIHRILHGSREIDRYLLDD